MLTTTEQPAQGSHTAAEEMSEKGSVANLMSSIENKLSMLACEDQSHYASMSEQSPKQSPPRQFLTATHDGKRGRLHITELQTSIQQIQREEQASMDRLQDSRVMDRINKMQLYYMDKIQSLNTQLSILQCEHEDLSNKYQQVQNQNRKLADLLEIRDRQMNSTMNQRVEQIKKQMISQFSNQASLHYEEHHNQMKHLKIKLSQQNTRMQYLEDEVEILRSEKNNLEVFYHNLLQEHRNMIKLDLVKQKEDLDKETKSFYCSTAKEKNFVKSTNTTKPKSKKKKTNRSVIKEEGELSKEEMIPYLAQGIKELKEKLNLK